MIRESLQLANDFSWWQQLHLAKIRKLEAQHKRKGTKMVPIEPPVPKFRQFQHYIMNLPATAVEFLGTCD